MIFQVIESKSSWRVSIHQEICKHLYGLTSQLTFCQLSFEGRWETSTSLFALFFTPTFSKFQEHLCKLLSLREILTIDRRFPAAIFKRPSMIYNHSISKSLVVFCLGLKRMIHFQEISEFGNAQLLKSIRRVGQNFSTHMFVRFVHYRGKELF